MHAIRLDHLLDGVDGVLVDRHGPAWSGTRPPEVSGIAILDPDDGPAEESRARPGELVLVIGARGRSALPLARAAARGGAAAVAVKGPVLDPGALGFPLLVVRPGVRWDQLAMLLRERLEVAELGHGPAEPGPGPAGNDLFGLAEHTAVATGGVVTIEDAGSRVLAYSRSNDDVDELRRLSILGWRGPESYLRMLREWGVFDRLRAAEQVVHVEAHPELGIRPRLAVGIRAGARYLGTIWVQRGGTPFAPRAEEALIGAARLAAAGILRRRTGFGLDRGPHDTGGELLADLLTGRASTDLAAGRLDLDPGSPALVVGFGAPIAPDPPARGLHLEQTLGLVAVYATAHHRRALVGSVADRVYAVLPGEPGERAEPVVLSWARHAITLLRATMDTAVCAGIGLPAPTLAGLAEARSEADRVLDALLRHAGRSSGQPGVATIGELRAEVLLAETLDLLADRPELCHPGVAVLVAHELVGSVLAYLDAFGDVRAAAAALTVHPNTLRYRLRRARALSGIDLDDPRERLACHLQLLLANRRAGGPG